MSGALTKVAVGGLAAGAAVAVAGTLGVRAAARSIRSNPDPYPREAVSREPVGDERVVDRPDGTRLHVVVAGDGPTVVLAHGFAVTSVEWSIVWDRLLAAGYRVVAFDQRGHGRSTIGADGIGSLPMAEDYLAVLEAVDARDAVLVGHSMGGFLALRGVLDVPGLRDRLSGLVLFSTFAGDVLRDAPQNQLQIPLLQRGILQRLAASDTLGTLFGASVCGDTPSPAMVDVFRETFLAQDHQALLPILAAFAEEDRYDRLGEIDLPTVVVCGRSDRTTPPQHSERLAAGIPGARAEWVDGKGHMLNWESPESLVAAVVSLSALTTPTE